MGGETNDITKSITLPSRPLHLILCLSKSGLEKNFLFKKTFSDSSIRICTVSRSVPVRRPQSTRPCLTLPTRETLRSKELVFYFMYIKLKTIFLSVIFLFLITAKCTVRSSNWSSA